MSCLDKCILKILNYSYLVVASELILAMYEIKIPLKTEKCCTKRGFFNWLNQDDQMNLTKPWQQRTLIIELDRNWNRQTLWNWQTLTWRPGPPNFRAWCFYLWNTGLITFNQKILKHSLSCFSCRGAKQGWTGVPASASLRAGAGGNELNSKFNAG